jgi:glycosyltransferase involved in cell wall biosynthesis
MASTVPRFSIVVPAYNRAATVSLAVDSILRQDIDDLEVIVVDDGSTDETAAVVAAYDDPRVRLTSQHNAGAGAARNTGVALARGDLLTFLDSDDEALPGWLAAYASAFDGGADIVSCAVTDVDAAGRPLASPVRRPKDYGARFGHAVGLFVHGGTYALRRSIFDEVGGFEPSLMSSEHTELAYRLLPMAQERGWVVRAIDEPYLRHTVGTPSSLRAEDEKVLQGASYLLEHYRDRFGSDRRWTASHAATAGVRAARLGRVREARRFFGQACRARPGDARNWLRLAVTAVPPLARRAWARP